MRERWNQAYPCHCYQSAFKWILDQAGTFQHLTSEMDPHRAGGSYAHFAGKECARALGKMTMDPKDCSGSVEDLTEGQMKILHDWEEKFRSKYAEVGKVGPLNVILGA